MKYKVGDRVRVRQWNAMAREFRVDKDGDLVLSIHYFHKNMKQYCGQVVTISRDCNVSVGYRVKEDGGEWIWTDDMFEGYAFEYGDEIEVSNDGKGWEKKIYLGFIDGQKPSYVAVWQDCEDRFRKGKSFSVWFYKYARPIQKPCIHAEGFNFCPNCGIKLQGD